MAISLVFYTMATGPKIPPIDTIMPVEISIEKWRSGQAVNRLVTVSDVELSAQPGDELRADRECQVRFL